MKIDPPRRRKLKIAKREGFTLIELMVAMAIIGILAATAMVNFGKNEDRDVRQEKDRLTSFLREVQNKALAGEIPAESLVLGCYSGGKFTCNKICGYGVQSASASSASLQAYFVYDDTDINSDCSTVASWQKKSLEKFFLRSGVTATSSDDVLFHVPDGKVYKGINPLAVGDNVTINLTKGTSINATIDYAGNIN